MSLTYKMMDSPVGPLKLVASDQGLVAVLYDERPNRVRLEEAAGDVATPLWSKVSGNLRSISSVSGMCSHLPSICGALLFRSVFGGNC